MKKLLLTKWMLLLCALVVGSGSVWAEEGTINFGSATGSTNVNAASVNGPDSQGNSWTVTTEGTSSFTPQSGYAQVGSKNSPATTITFTTTLPNDVIVTAFSAKFGGNSSTAGTITLKVGETTVGTGSLNGSEDVIVSNTSSSKGKVLTVTVTNISRGVKAYYISYTYEVISTGEATITTISDDGITNTNKFVSTEAGTLTASVTHGSPAVAVPEASVTWSGNNDAVATINSSTGAVTLVGAGTVTFTASYAGVDDEYKPSSDTYVMTVTNEDPSFSTIWSEDFSSYSADDVPTGGTYSYVCVNGNSATKVYEAALAGGVSPELLINKKGTNNNGSFSATIPLNNIYSGTLKLSFKNNNTIGVSVKDNNNTVLLSSTSVSANTTTGNIVEIPGITTETTSITIEWSNGSSSNVRLDDIVLKGKIAPASVTVSAANYATFCDLVARDFSASEITVYTAKSNGTSVQLTEVTDGIVPANTGVVLYYDGGTTAEIPAVATDKTTLTDNELIGVNEATNVAYDGEGSKKNFILSNESAGVGFYKAAAAGAKLAAHRAYLSTANVNAAREFLGFTDDETTGIETVNNVQCSMFNGQCFDLQGRRVAQPTKGLYIVNGRKVVIK